MARIINKTEDEATPSGDRAAIYYISKQAIIIGDERKCKPVALHSSCSLGKTEKQETMLQNMLRKLQSIKDSDFISTAHRK